MSGPHITDNFNENSVHQPRCMAVRSIMPNSEVQSSDSAELPSELCSAVSGVTLGDATSLSLGFVLGGAQTLILACWWQSPPGACTRRVSESEALSAGTPVWGRALGVRRVGLRCHIRRWLGDRPSHEGRQGGSGRPRRGSGSPVIGLSHLQTINVNSGRPCQIPSRMQM